MSIVIILNQLNYSKVNEDIFKIQLKLLDKYYSYNCKRSEEEITRKAAKNFTEKFLDYSCKYPSFEKIDLLAVVGLHFALEVLKNNDQQDVSILFHLIQQLNKTLEEHFNNYE